MPTTQTIFSLLLILCLVNLSQEVWSSPLSLIELNEETEQSSEDASESEISIVTNVLEARIVYNNAISQRLSIFADFRFSITFIEIDSPPPEWV